VNSHGARDVMTLESIRVVRTASSVSICYANRNVFSYLLTRTWTLDGRLANDRPTEARLGLNIGVST